MKISTKFGVDFITLLAKFITRSKPAEMREVKFSILKTLLSFWGFSYKEVENIFMEYIYSLAPGKWGIKDSNSEEEVKERIKEFLGKNRVLQNQFILHMAVIMSLDYSVDLTQEIDWNSEIFEFSNDFHLEIIEIKQLLIMANAIASYLYQTCGEYENADKNQLFQETKLILTTTIEKYDCKKKTKEDFQEYIKNHHGILRTNLFGAAFVSILEDNTVPDAIKNKLIELESNSDKKILDSCASIYESSIFDNL